MNGNNLKDIRSLSLYELKDEFVLMGEKAFRGAGL